MTDTSLASAQALVAAHAEKMLRRSLRRALEAAGFEPDFNVCVGCKHHGSRHDLNNICLDCGDRFGSMSENEKWEHGIDRYFEALRSA